MRRAWSQGAQNVVMRLDTGGGKTVVLSDIVDSHQGAAAVIAHRHELVSQLSVALARNGVRHNLIAAKSTRQAIVAEHMAEFGRSFYDPGSRHAVASVDTLVKADGLDAWNAQVTLWVTDEGHHLVRDNKWHTVMSRFTHPQVRGLLPTATPRRADGKGLGRHADGVADAMVQGPPMRWLIEQGYLTDYRIVCPTTDMELLESDIGASGDWSPAKLRAAAKGSRIVGDVVGSYQRFARGLLGVTFCPDTETAGEIQRAYEAAGVPAGLLTGKTLPGPRRATLRAFRERRLLQLVVVDIVSEGFDMPAIECASFARKTASLATYMQQFGRTLRPMAGKDKALIIDHVGNFVHHGPPDRPRDWSLSRGEKRTSAGGGIPLRICLSCVQPYERVKKACPWCGAPAPEPVARNAPAMVDGDLAELDADTLARLRGAVDALDMPLETYRETLAASGVPPIGQMAHVKRRHAAQEAQRALRDAMGRWGGAQRALGLTDSEMQRKFFFTFGLDVLSAMALGTDEADALRGRIDG